MITRNTNHPNTYAWVTSPSAQRAMTGYHPRACGPRALPSRSAYSRFALKAKEARLRRGD